MKDIARSPSVTLPLSRPGLSSQEAERILGSFGGLRYGSVEVVIHDGKVVQIERKEKVRFDRDDSRR